MPSDELSRRTFSRVVGGSLAVPLGASSLTDSLTTPRPSARWQFDTGAEIATLPGLHRGVPFIDDTLFLHGHETLRAVDNVTGDQRWQFDVGDDSSGLAVGTDAVYVTDGDVLHSLGIDGSKRWDSRLEGTRHDVYGATAAGDAVYASSTGGLYALDATNGTDRWQFEENLGTPTVTDDAVYGTGSDFTTEILYALHPSDGTERWRFELDDGPSFFAGVVEETCYLWRQGDLFALDASDGTERWRFDTNDDSRVFSGELTESVAYVCNEDERTLTALDARSGTVEWQFEADSRPWYTTAELGDVVVFETEATVHVLDATDGSQRWRYDRKLNPDQFLSYADRETVYTQDDGALYALDVADGAVRWRFAPDDGRVVYARRIDDTTYAGTDAGTLYALEGPVRTPINATVSDIRANAGTVSLVTLLGGGLTVAGYRRLRTRGTDEESGDSAGTAEIELLEPVNADGPLELYEARLPDGRNVVAKLLSEEADVTRDQFLAAVETWAELDHESVQPVLDWGTEPAPWVALPDATGQPVAERKGLTVAERVEALAAACEAVHTAHREGITHSHLAPEDVRFPSRDSQPADVRVGGWLAGVLPDEEPRSSYAAPEQVGGAETGEPDPVRTDVYRLGAVTYHAVTGQSPDGDATEWTPPTDLNVELPAQIDDVLADAMAAKPDERYRSALKLGDMLRWAVRQ